MHSFFSDTFFTLNAVTGVISSSRGREFSSSPGKKSRIEKKNSPLLTSLVCSIFCHEHTHAHTHTHMACTAEYDGLCNQWVRRWVKSPICDEQVLLHLSCGQTMPVVLMTCCLRAARFLSSSATRNSSNDAVANWHVLRHCARSNGAVLSDWGRRPHLFMLVLTFAI